MNEKKKTYEDIRKEKIGTSYELTPEEIGEGKQIVDDLFGYWEQPEMFVQVVNYAFDKLPEVVANTPQLVKRLPEFKVLMIKYPFTTAKNVENLTDILSKRAKEIYKLREDIIENFVGSLKNFPQVLVEFTLSEFAEAVVFLLYLPQYGFEFARATPKIVDSLLHSIFNLGVTAPDIMLSAAMDHLTGWQKEQTLTEAEKAMVEEEKERVAAHKSNINWKKIGEAL